MRYNLVEPYNGGEFSETVVKLEWWLVMCIIIGVIAVVVIGMVIVYCCCLYKKAKRSSSKIYKVNKKRHYIEKCQTDASPLSRMETLKKSDSLTTYEDFDKHETITVYNNITNMQSLA